MSTLYTFCFYTSRPYTRKRIRFSKHHSAVGLFEAEICSAAGICSESSITRGCTELCWTQKVIAAQLPAKKQTLCGRNLVGCISGPEWWLSILSARENGPGWCLPSIAPVLCNLRRTNHENRSKAERPPIECCAVSWSLLGCIGAVRPLLGSESMRVLDAFAWTCSLIVVECDCLRDSLLGPMLEENLFK